MKGLRKFKPSDQTLDIEQVLSLFDLPDYDSLSESNWEYIEDSALFSYAYKHDLEFDSRHWTMSKECESCDGYGTDENENDCSHCESSGRIYIDIESIRDTDEWQTFYSEAEKPLYDGWLSAVESVLDVYLAHHDLQAERILIRATYERHEDKKQVIYWRPGYLIKPTRTWKSACSALVDTINGIGYFWFDSALEFKDHIPVPSYKQAVLWGMHNIAESGSVYDMKSPQRLYESKLENNLRYA